MNRAQAAALELWADKHHKPLPPRTVTSRKGKVVNPEWLVLVMNLPLYDPRAYNMGTHR